MKSVEGHIHVEVRKLYPDAELPSFECGEPAPGQFAMVYRSSRPFSALAEGLIKGCVAHFGETIDIQSERLPDGRGTRFLLTKRSEP